jgi:hypothetical protein
MRTLAGIATLAALCCNLVFAQKKLTLKDLPPDVQKGTQLELKGGEIRNIGKETERGVAQYEVETMMDGKHRDFNVDTKGRALSV